MVGGKKLVDTSTAALKSTLGSFAFGGYGQQIVKGFVWTFWLILAAAIFYLVYIFVAYKIKATVMHVTGSGNKDFPFTIGKKTWDRIKVNKDGSWSWLLRSFPKGTKEEKFPDKYVYPANNVVAYKVGNKIFPAKINFDGLDKFSISPVPYDVRRKIELETQQIDMELQKQDWWTQGGKQMLIALGFAFIVVAFAAFVIWLAFKKTDMVIPHMDKLSDSLRSFGEIPAK